MPDFPLGSVKRHPQCEHAVGRDADTAGFAAAADDGVGQFIESALIFDSVEIVLCVIHERNSFPCRGFLRFYLRRLLYWRGVILLY